MRIRRAIPADAPAIHRLIAAYAAQGRLLPREEAEILEHASRFLVLEEKNQLAGCVALENYSGSLAEIRSLALVPHLRGRGLGARLVQAALREARRKGIARVFAVTERSGFFVRQGFSMTPRNALQEKVEHDCCHCAKRRTCGLEAVICDMLPGRATLDVLHEPAELVPLA